MCQENNCGCQLEYPHTHLVAGKTCQCEKGNGKLVPNNLSNLLTPHQG